jgi:hypothetical protein
MQAFSRYFVVLAVAAALVAGFPPRLSHADVTCGHCGCVMHTDNAPPRCWQCGQPLFSPAPPQDPNSGFPPMDDLGPMSSGFELGVRFVSTARGIRVTRVKPGSAAAGVLFVNDIIAAAAFRDDNGHKQVLPTRTGADIETVKHFAGQSKTALMIRRPSGQVRYAFVVFRPVGGGEGVAVAAGKAYAGGVEGGIELDETGEAAALFGGQQGSTEGEQGPDDAAQDFFNGR